MREGVVIGLDLLLEGAPPNVAVPMPLAPLLHVSNERSLLFGKRTKFEAHRDFNVEGVPVKGWTPSLARLAFITCLVNGNQVICHSDDVGSLSGRGWKTSE